MDGSPIASILSHLSACHSQPSILYHLSAFHSQLSILYHLSAFHSQPSILYDLSVLHSQPSILYHLSAFHSQPSILYHLSYYIRNVSWHEPGTHDCLVRRYMISSPDWVTNSKKVRDRQEIENKEYTYGALTAESGRKKPL